MPACLQTLYNRLGGIRFGNGVAICQIRDLTLVQYPGPHAYIVDQSIKEPTIATAIRSDVESLCYRCAHPWREWRSEINRDFFPIIINRPQSGASIKGHGNMMPFIEGRLDSGIRAMGTGIRQLGKGLHVSTRRHLGGDRPVRWGCFPEETPARASGYLEPSGDRIGKGSIGDHLAIDINILFLCLTDGNGSRSHFGVG